MLDVFGELLESEYDSNGLSQCEGQIDGGERNREIPVRIDCVS